MVAVSYQEKKSNVSNWANFLLSQHPKLDVTQAEDTICFFNYVWQTRKKNHYFFYKNIYILKDYKMP